jgi:hypothetical protein
MPVRGVPVSGLIESVSVPPVLTLNREAWLNELSKLIHPLFKGFTMRPYRLTCGWPCRGGLGRRRRVVGECHALESSRAGVHEIFVSPTLDKPTEVAGVVTHEMSHVAAGIEAGHGKGFVKVARHIGLTKGRPTSALPGPRLGEKLARFVHSLGTYPHDAVLPALKPCRPRTTVTLSCSGCPCKVVMGLKCYQEVGAPTCACGRKLEADIVVVGE